MILAALQCQQIGDQIVDLLGREDLPVAARMNPFLISSGEVRVRIHDRTPQVRLGVHPRHRAAGTIADVGQVRSERRR